MALKPGKNYISTTPMIVKKSNTNMFAIETFLTQYVMGQDNVVRMQDIFFF